MTRQREITLSALKNLDSHPTADEVYQIVRRRIPRISLGTVYRNLDVLCEQGLVNKLEFGGAQRRYDGRTHYHHHARCTNCERLFDLPVSAVGPINLSLPDDLDFEVSNVLFEVRGVCHACRERLQGDGPTAH
ncbi:MAG: transcriptional repressor [Candidatus Lernaella stagnicola]|nr:transcriptional repressor [Candidatus Lernaella stagnicola]